MHKVFQHTNFSKLSTTLVFGIALFALLNFLFFDSLFEKTSFALGVILTIMFGALSILIIYIIMDVWLERIIISNNRIIYQSVLGKKEILNSNIKGYHKDGQHTTIYSKDGSIILCFDNKLKNDEKITSYLKKRYEYLDEEE